MFQSLKDGVLALPAGMFWYGLIFHICPSILFLYYLGGVMIPFVIAGVIAYVLVSLNDQLVSLGVSSRISMKMVVGLGLLIMFGVLFFIAPLVWQQSVNLAREMPQLLSLAKNWSIQSFSVYFGDDSVDVITAFFSYFSDGILKTVNLIAHNTFGSLMNIGVLSLYLVLIPVVVYFFVVDRYVLMRYFERFLSNDSKLVFQDYWSKVDHQLVNYIQGKFLEILYVSVSAFVIFTFLNLKYALLLSTAVGLSVLVPFIGAIAVTLPVIGVAFAQWGFDYNFYAVVSCYLLLQIVDGNIIVPMIFSGKMKLHPVAILLAVLIFGAVGGIVGVFFAIPLVALTKIYIDKNYPILESDVVGS